MSKRAVVLRAKVLIMGLNLVVEFLTLQTQLKLLSATAAEFEVGLIYSG